MFKHYPRRWLATLGLLTASLIVSALPIITRLDQVGTIHPGNRPDANLRWPLAGPDPGTQIEVLLTAELSPPSITPSTTPSPSGAGGPFLYVAGHNLVRMNPDGTTTPLTNLGPERGEIDAVFLSPTGQQIVLSLKSPNDLGNDIYFLDLKGTFLTHLTHATLRGWSPSWSPDGSRLAFIGGTDFEAAHLYIVNADGSQLRRLAQSIFLAPLAGPIWLADGQRLLFDGQARQANNYLWNIYRVNTSDSDLTCLVCDGAGSPSFGRTFHLSPTENQFVYQRGPDLYLGQVNGGEPRNLTTSLPGWTFFEAWQPDGQRIVFTVTDDFLTAEVEEGLFEISPAGTYLTRLPVPVLVSSLLWSPDRQKIAHLVLTQDKAELYIVNADGSHPIKLTPDDFSVICYIHFLAWSPDSTRLIFTAEDGQAVTDLFQIQADGSHLIRLTHTPGIEYFVAWLAQP